VKFQEVTKDDKRYRGTAESIELRDMAELETRTECAPGDLRSDNRRPVFEGKNR
jgi:hypothetical protein